jgi:hypothetical protein
MDKRDWKDKDDLGIYFDGPSRIPWLPMKIKVMPI